MRLSVFDAYNKTAAEPLKSPRNAAAGALRNLDPAVTATRRLDARFYNVGYIEGRSFRDQAEMLAFLRENRFPVSDCERYTATIDEAFGAIEEIESTRSELDYLIDGAVVKITDFATRAALGATDKFPRWAIAYKFEAQEVTATLERVTWELGRTGKLTPLAHVTPVELAGATVRRATLNNFGDITRKRVRLGAKVWIRRSNEVIPEIMGRVEAYVPGERDILPPEACPACGAALEERGANLFCPNRRCRPQVIARLSHFAGRDAMDIGNPVGQDLRATVRRAGRLGAGRSVRADERPAHRSRAVRPEEGTKPPGRAEASRRPPLDRFIFAVGIPGVGRKTARDLAERFGSLEAPRRGGRGSPHPGRRGGRRSPRASSDFLRTTKTSACCGAGAAGVEPVAPAAPAAGPLSGMVVVVTEPLAP